MRRRGAGLVDSASPASEPFRTLRLALSLRADSATGNIVLVTSAEAGAGKSTIAANYALVSALSHSRVLLIDADLRSPSIHSMFGVSRSPGLVEALAADSELVDFVRRVPGPSRLDVLASGRPIPRSSDLASSARMGELLREASESYDLVVLDSPPVLSAADTEGLASHPGVDVVFVARKNTRRRALRRAMRRLELIEAHVMGLVVNSMGRATAYRY